MKHVKKIINGCFVLGLIVFIWVKPVIATIYEIPGDLLQEGKSRLAIYNANPESAEATFELAMNYAYTGRIEKGWEILKKVPVPYADTVVKTYGAKVKSGQASWKDHFKLAFGYYFKDHKEDAKDEFRKVLELDPKQIWAMGFIGLIEGEQGHNQVGIDWCKKALAIERNATAIHFLLGEGYRRTGNYFGAMGEFMIVGRLKTEESVHRGADE